MLRRILSCVDIWSVLVDQCLEVSIKCCQSVIYSQLPPTIINSSSTPSDPTPPYKWVLCPQTPYTHGIMTRIHDIRHHSIITAIFFIFVYAILVKSCVSGSGKLRKNSRNIFIKFMGRFPERVLYIPWKYYNKFPH